MLKHFLISQQGHDIDAGSIGLIFILAGFPGAVMAGILLDKTKMFK
jgi:hypothetical protein